jgi:hypothetical protein
MDSATALHTVCSPTRSGKGSVAMSERRSQTRRVARGGIAAILAVAVALSACGGYIRHEELRRGVESLGSAAAEGKLLADDVARDRTRSTFARVHARELAEDVDHEAEKLRDAGAEGDLVQRKEDAVKLAQDISDALGDLEIAPGDETNGRHVAAKLDHYAKDAENLAGAL